MLSVTIETPDGAPRTNLDLGSVSAGSSSADVPFRIRNNGTVDLPAPKAWVEQGSVADGELVVVVDGEPLNAAPTTLAALPVGGTVAGVLRFVNPPGSAGLPVDTGTLRVEPE